VARTWLLILLWRVPLDKNEGVVKQHFSGANRFCQNRGGRESVDEANWNVRCAAEKRRRALRRRSLDSRCFSIFSTVEGVPRSGSEIKR